MITASSPNQTRGGSFIDSYGSKKFIRPKTDDVLDAVAQARFNEKKWVWVEDINEGYVRGHVLEEDESSQVLIEYENGGTATVDASIIKPMNPPKFDMVDDMAELTHLNEPSVIHNLTVRFKANHIYTYSGLFLVAVNPYKSLPIYTDNYIQSYKGRRRGEMAPHIYAVADQAYHDMVQDKENQSILVTGESGAGKTENTKIVIQYLTAIATSFKSDDLKNLDRLQNQILQANPILEAFGNAQTIRNNNSSRFGKFIRIEFNKRAQICGANIEWYLLEKSRVHHPAPKERNYHIFYQLLEADDDIKQELLLDGNADNYNFIKQCNKRIEGVDDREEYEKLLHSLDIMGIDDKDKLNLFRIVASILHLGNISVTNYRDRADIHDFRMVERACHLLGISAEAFKKSLLSPRIKAGRDWVTQAKSPQQVVASLDALAKTLYERNFAFLVEKVNEAIDGNKTRDKLGFIGVLDIAGFEIFESNSFEQLCINYTNEKLQQFFNQNMFELEQEEYQKENIDWNYIDFGRDLQPTIDLIEKTNPVGILSCLEEECFAPRGSDQRFLEKLNKFCDKDNPDAKYKSTRFQDGFILKHYAGDVEYSVSGWIERNKDPLNEDVTRLLAKSSQKHIASLFEDYLSDDNVDLIQPPSIPSSSSLSSMLKIRKGSGSFRTVAQRHKQQLLSLMNTLHRTHPHFVRCILPNDEKRPSIIQTRLVLDQLRCNGVLEGIRICRKGFPNRLSFDDFRKRYQLLCPELLKKKGFIDGRTACQILIEYMNLDKDKYQIGDTKVFFKATVLAEFEELRDNKLNSCITQFQAYCRRRVVHQFQNRFARQTEAIEIIQKNARHYIELGEWSWWKMCMKLKPLSEAYSIDKQMNEKNDRIAQLEDELKVQSQSLADLTVRHQELDDQQEKCQELIMADQATIQELRDINEDMHEKYEQSEKRVEELEQLVQDNQNKADTELEKVKQESEERQCRKEAELEKVKQAFEERQCRAEAELEKVKQAFEEHQKQASTELEQMKSMLEDANERNRHLEEELVESKLSNENLQAEIIKFVSDHRELHELKSKTENELEETKSKEMELRDTNTQQEEKIDGLEKDIKDERESHLEQITEKDAIIDDLRTSLETIKNEAVEEVKNLKESKEQCSQLELEIKRLQELLAIETQEKNTWKEKHDHLYADWENLTCLIKAEHEQTKARIDRYDQVLGGLQFIPLTKQ